MGGWGQFLTDEGRVEYSVGKVEEVFGGWTTV